LPSIIAVWFGKDSVGGLRHPAGPAAAGCERGGRG